MHRTGPGNFVATLPSEELWFAATTVQTEDCRPVYNLFAEFNSSGDCNCSEGT
jgi:hypothetical protein